MCVYVCMFTLPSVLYLNIYIQFVHVDCKLQFLIMMSIFKVFFFWGLCVMKTNSKLAIDDG
jgi:hypothetical protein